MGIAKDDTAVSVKNLSKSFSLPHERTRSIKSLLINFFRKSVIEKQKVLKGVSFEIKKGDFFGIVGRNGSGKSTLLKLLAGIYEPDAGAIKINGSLTPFIELGVGFNPELTGRENVFLNGALLGFNRKEMSAMYDDIVEFAELERFMDQKLKNYSSGMQVRLAFSIAIRARSDILLLDEVLAVGDAVFQKKCYEYFHDLQKSGTTVIFVSHDTESLLRFCKNGVLIDNGVLQKVGPIQTVVDAYRSSLIPYSQQADEEVESTDKSSTKEPKKQKLVTIKNCRVLDVGGTPQTAFKTGESMVFELGLKLAKDFKPPLNIAIGMYFGSYSNGAYAFGASTQIDEIEMPTGIKKIQLKLQKPPLRNGQYTLYVSAFGESEEVPYDYVPEIATVEIKGAPTLRSRGAIIAEHTWSFE